MVGLAKLSPPAAISVGVPAYRRRIAMNETTRQRCRARALVDEVIVAESNGLLPHPVYYAQVEPSRFPVTAGALRDAGYHEVRYRWSHIPTGKSGATTLWVSVRRWADVLVGFWNRVGGTDWKYSL